MSAPRLLQRGFYGLVCDACFAGGRMDIISRLILSILLLGSTGLSFAFGTVATNNTAVYSTSYYVPTNNYPSCAAAYEADYQYQLASWAGLSAPANTATKGSLSCPSGTTGSWSAVTTRGDGATYSVGGSATTGLGCPSNALLVGSSCICSAGYSPNTGATACVAQPSGACQAIVDSLNGSDEQLTAPSASSTVCHEGCKITSGYRATGPLGSYLMAPFSASGEACNGTTGSGTDTTGAPPIPLSAGMCPGTIGGTTVLVPCSSTSATGASSAASAPAGTASAPSGLMPGSTTTDTVCSGNQCTTTTTTLNSSGTPVGVETKTEDKPSFCAENPGLQMCKDTAISGSCDAVSCSGDAIQCAIVSEMKRRNCQVLDAAPSDAPAVVAAAAGIHPATHPYVNGTTSALTFDNTDLITASCPSDVNVSMGGSFPPVVLPFSHLCSPAAWLGNLLVGLTALACLGIVFRTKGG